MKLSRNGATGLLLEGFSGDQRDGFYASDVFAPWRHKLFIGALKDKEVIVMRVDGNTVTEEGRILGDRKQRIRDVRVGPDGYLYVLTDESDGQLLKVSPAATR